MLCIHRAERADGLVEALGAVVAEPLDDPMQPEVVGVPTRGVERWLTQRLSGRLGTSPGRSDGVCANIDFPFPGRLVGGAVAAATGMDRESDPWLAERSVWPLLDVVDGCLAEPWLAALAAHLGGTGPDADLVRRTRRFGTVRHVADLYDRYGVHRPEMLRAWAAGDDSDGTGRALPADAAWQAELWRRLRDRIGHPSPAERLEDACARLEADPALSNLPRRLSLFGLTRLPASYLQVLRALAKGRDVHLFLLHPSPVLWSRVAGANGDRPGGVVRRRDDVTAGLPDNPLLASWGQDAREMQLVLTAGDGVLGDDHRPLEQPEVTLLQRIQADVRSDRAPPGVPLPGQDDARALLDPVDRSLQVHACHGRARQVEVVRDAILHLLAEDPTIEARDVIVMCPDIETFAPLVHATFGAADVEDDEEDGGLPAGPRPPDLRVRLADRSLRQTNPVLGVVSELLELASARLTASQVLDLAAREPVRRRFRFDDDDLTRMTDWVADTGVRWGLDAAHRAPFGLERLEANTWRAGLDRVLLGVAMAEEGYRLVGDTLPFDDVESGAIDLAGRLAEFVDRLEAALDGLQGPQPVEAWGAAISAAVETLTDTGARNAWQGAQLRRQLDDILSEATAGNGRVAGGNGGAAASAAPLALPEIRDLLAQRLRGRPTRANFRTGHMTVCTLVPMRSVPHRVVCLLGLDDGTFPRRTALDGDDLILADPHVGDRDARSEDRQLLLDALLAATDHLVITYTGRDERTNTERPSAVPVGELLDVIDRTVRSADGEGAPARERVVVHHPLQPFDPRNFTAGALVPATTWSFDAVALDGARALSDPRRDPAPFLPGPLAADPPDPVEVDQLVRFVQHPTKAFLRQRLGIALYADAEDVAEALPVQLHPLEQWDVGTRLLHARLAGVDPDLCVAAEKARGTLPPGEIAQPLLDQLGQNIEGLVAAVADVAAGADPPGPVEVDVRLPDGRSLIGTVPDVCALPATPGRPEGGLMVRTVNYSKVGAKHRLAAWVRFLALTAARPDLAVEAVTVGRRREGGRSNTKVTVARLPALPGPPDARRRAALGQLGVLVDLYDRGLREPLPLACESSAAWAKAARATGKRKASPADAAAKAWDSTYDERDNEDRDLEHLLVLGGERTMAEVLNAGPAPDEEGDGWAPDEQTRFGRYARRLWDGLLDVETLEDR
jgi:exodeoxyribonuclease V gamma subunit